MGASHSLRLHDNSVPPSSLDIDTFQVDSLANPRFSNNQPVSGQPFHYCMVSREYKHALDPRLRYTLVRHLHLQYRRVDWLFRN